MHTTDTSLGPGRFTLITQRQNEAKIRYFSDDDPVIPYIQTVIRLTESQRTPEWFLLRKFRITGTGVYAAVWMLLSSYPDADRDENINAVLRVLNLLRGFQVEEVLLVDEVDYTRVLLNEMVLSDLRVICRNKKLPVSGTKAVLVERIMVGQGALRDNSRQDEESEAPTLLSVLMKTCLWRPSNQKRVGKGH